MSAFYKFLFPMKPDGTAISLLLLALRLLFGGLLLSHGMQKWTNFDSMSASFPDPLGVGHSISLGLAIFGDKADPVLQRFPTQIPIQIFNTDAGYRILCLRTMSKALP